MDRIDLGQLESLFPVSWTSRGVTDIPQGSTLASIAPEETTDGTWSAIHNGRMLRPVSWEHTIINDGDQVIFSPLPEDFVAIGAWLWQALGYALVGVAVGGPESTVISLVEPDSIFSRNCCARSLYSPPSLQISPIVRANPLNRSGKMRSAGKQSNHVDLELGYLVLASLKSSKCSSAICCGM